MAAWVSTRPRCPPTRAGSRRCWPTTTVRISKRTADCYFERFDPESIASEPFADNPAPNRALEKLGFRLIKRHRTVPSSIAFEQDIHRWQITRKEWQSRSRRA